MFLVTAAEVGDFAIVARMLTRAAKVAIALLCLHALPARADNSPESALKTFKDYVLPKISFACGRELSAEYDGASLRQHDTTIAHDQTSGDRECNEPFRYLWFVCQTDAGKAAVKKAGITGVRCKGSAAKVSTLQLTDGKLVVERSGADEKSHVHLRQRFEALLKVQVVFGERSGPEPYGDQTFSDLMGKPNPSLSQTDYCLVNGERLELMPLYRLGRVRTGQIKCWEHGQVIVDLSLRDGRKTGLVTEHDSSRTTIASHYRDDKLHGEVRRTQNGALKSLAHYEDGKRIWSQEHDLTKNMVSYSHQYPDGVASISVTHDGRVFGLQCTPGARADKQLQAACGFGAPRTTRIYDGTHKVNRIETWRDGVLVERKAGDSAYAERSEVSYQANEKHGRERLLREDGSLEAEIDWQRGLKHGRELRYDDSGRKVVTEIVWRSGQKQVLTEYFLNGSRKLQQQWDGERSLREQTFWDNGQLRSDTPFVACRGRAYGRNAGFCEQGVARSYHEDGSRSEEAQYQLGQRHGSRHAFWSNGKPAAVEQYSAGVLQKARRWQEDGKLVLDEEYEADGSRKLRR